MRIYHELNLGAGVQSTTLALMFEEGLIVDSDGIPIHIDVAYFADTGEEPVAVYKHLHWLSSHIKTFPIKTVSKGKLGDDLMRGVNSTGQRFASIPAYTKEAGSSKEGQTRRQCSKEYKIDPSYNWTRLCGRQERSSTAVWMRICSCIDHASLSISYNLIRSQSREIYNSL